MKEHVTRDNSAIFQHTKEKGHIFDTNKVEILGSEENTSLRKIKEAIHIRQSGPSFAFKKKTHSFQA